MVERLLGGALSPRSACTVPSEFRDGAGIPQDAEYYCFIHPLSSFVAREVLRSGALKLSRNPWAFVLLMGGFAYFDQAGKLSQVNAITFTPPVSASHPGLLMVGHELPAADRALQAMQAQVKTPYLLQLLQLDSPSICRILSLIQPEIEA